MSEERQPGTDRRKRRDENRGMWKRLALALPVSILAHLLVLLVGRPEYSDVADFAVDLEVVEIEPGKPATSPEPEPENELEPEQQPEPEQETTPEPEPEGEPEEPGQNEPTEIAMVEEHPSAHRDGGLPRPDDRDAGPSAVAALEGDGGPGEGTGICFHDVFPYAGEDPSWMLWVSMSSFKDTIYEKGLARTLGSFSLYKDMVGATGLDPYAEVEGFLVTADDFSDWRTYRVVATYGTGEEVLRSRLAKNRGSAAGFEWTKTTAGVEGALPGQYRWHLVGSGRVLTVTHEPRRPAKKKSATLRPDGGVRGTAVPDGGPTPAKSPPAPHPPSFPDWPRQVTCMTRLPAPEGPTGGRFRDVVRSRIGPDAEGHWPVALIATRDPRAVGDLQVPGAETGFRWALVEAYFTDPVRLEGIVRLAGTPKQMRQVASGWKRMVARAGSDPIMKLAGLGHLFDELTLEPVDDGVKFRLELTESQIQAALLFLQLQGEQLDEMINRRTSKKSDARNAN